MQTKIRIDTTKRTPICQNIQPLRCAIVNVYSKKLCKKKKNIFYVLRYVTNLFARVTEGIKYSF